MAEKKPLCNYGGEVRELQSGDSLPVVGSGQSWQNVTSARVAGTTYTNTTGKPILVHITASMPAGSSMYINIDGVAVSYFSTGSTLARGDVEALIPAGSSYSLTVSSATKTNWYELR